MSGRQSLFLGRETILDKGKRYGLWYCRRGHLESWTLIENMGLATHQEASYIYRNIEGGIDEHVQGQDT